MKDTRIARAVTALIIVVSAAGTAEAQVNGRFTLPTATPRLATERPAPPPVVFSQQMYPYYPVYPVGYTLVPGIVMSDGSIYTGYERGGRGGHHGCQAGLSVAGSYAGGVYSSVPTYSTGQIPVVAGNGVVLSSGAQVAPQQVTQSQLNLPSAQVARQRQAQQQAQQHAACSSR